MSDFNIQFDEQDQVITLEFEQIGGGAVKSVNGKTGVVVLDADDVGAYTKPSGGIPKTDLASAVQTSLGKADSAYQKPSGGIPANDIASGVIPTVDSTLAISGAAADAKKTGDEISDLKDGLTAVESDVTDLKEDYTDILNSAYVTDTASGAIASFPDGADGVPVKSLMVDIEPVQDLHGQDAPYPAGGSVNKLPPMVDGTYSGNGVTAVVKDGIATLSGTTTASGNALIIPLAESITVPDGYVHMMNSVGNGTVEPSFESASDPGGTSMIINMNPSNKITSVQASRVGKTWNRIRFYLASGVTLSGTFAPMIIADNTARSSYIPYSNICPISGHTQAVVKRTGKNLFDIGTQPSDYTMSVVASVEDNVITFNVVGSGGTFAYRTQQQTAHGTFTISGTASEAFSRLFVQLRSLDDTRWLTSSDVTISGWIYNAYYGGWYINNNTVDISHTVTIPSDCSYWLFGLGYANNVAQAGTQETIRNIQLEVGSTASTFEPYTADTYTIDLDGTRYGGTLDVTTGVLTITHAFYQFTGSETINGSVSNAYINTSNFPTPMLTGTWYTDAKTVCDCLPKTNVGKGIRFGADNRTIYFYDLQDIVPAITDKASLDAWIASQKPCITYPIEPVTIQLTANEVATLLGQNNIWSDAGTVDVTYRADTKLYIEKLTAPTEDDLIADHAISANSFFMVGNNLYRATTAIASGATITVGTNATKLSLSDALNALA